MTPSQEVDGRLDTNLIEEVNMQETESVAELIEETTSRHDKEEHTTGSVEFVQNCSPSINDAPAQVEQPEKPAVHNAGKVVAKTPVNTAAPSITAFSFSERRQLAHIHTLKQMVASDESLTNLAFDDDDYAQAAKIYDNLNSTACFTRLPLDFYLKQIGVLVLILRIILFIKP